MMDATYMNKFHDDVSSEEEIDEPPQKRRRMANRIWLEKQIYNTREEAEKSIHALWKKCSTTTTPLGVRVDYRCSGGEYRCIECPVGLYLLYHASNIKVRLYFSFFQFFM